MELDQLKAEQAAEENETEATQAEVVEETAEAEETPEVETPDTDATGEGGEAEGDESQAEDWMLTGSEESGSSEQIPLSAHISTRNKLKGKIADVNSENEELKARLAVLEANRQPAAPQVAPTQSLKRPEALDYGTDDEYHRAETDYINQLVQQQVQLATQTTQAQNRQNEGVQKVTSAVDAHYGRAQTLIADKGIKPELYQAADSKVRQALESVMPGQGDATADYLISLMGEDSAKIMYQLGVNEGVRNKLITSIIGDMSGNSAAVFVGELKSKMLGSQNISSTALAPAPRVTGGKSEGSKAHKSKFNKACESGSFQAIFNAKKAARQAGVDTSNW